MSTAPRAPLVAVKLTPVGRAQSYLLGKNAGTVHRGRGIASSYN